MICPESALAVMAHPDDAELWAGGTLARLARQGTAVTVAVARHPEPIRNAEAAAGADILGVRLHLLDQSMTDAVAALLRAVRPHVMITHPLADTHPDHRIVATAVLDVLPDVVIATGRPRSLYTCDTYNGLTTGGPVPAHTIVDVTDTFDVKLRALAAHASQPIAEHFGPMAEHLGRLWGARIGTRYAENYVPIPVLGRLPAAPTLL